MLTSPLSGRDKPSGVEGFPLRKWNIQLFLLNEHGEEIPATIFSKALYKLHPSFEKRANQSKSSPNHVLRRLSEANPSCPAAITAPPFRISEEGWGEFDMEIILTAIDKGGDYPLTHDLNFQSPRYEAKHTIVGSP